MEGDQILADFKRQKELKCLVSRVQVSVCTRKIYQQQNSEHVMYATLCKDHTHSLTSRVHINHIAIYI